MSVIFKRKSFKEDCDSIVNIIYDEKYGRVQNYLAKSFELDLDLLYILDKKTGYSIISQALSARYENSEIEITDKIDKLASHWNDIEFDIFRILYDIFECEKIYKKDIIAEFSINSVCPRYLDRWSFDINYRKSIEEMVLTCIHEIIHFVWFEKWAELFENTSKEEFNAPSATWLLSEIVIDAIIKETELKKYCSEKQLAYKHFYDIHIDGVNVMEYFGNLFNSCDIREFMSEGYRYVVENKQLLW